MKVTHTLKPIYNKESKILILGSMPSVKSRKDGFYYAHPMNRFWKIMEMIFNVNLKSNTEKESFLLENNIALWDVFSEVEIRGSSDATIKEYKLNNIEIILSNSNIKAIFCTGKTSYEGLTKNFKTVLPIFYLPSPSSANASKSIETLVTDYKIILDYIKK